MAAMGNGVKPPRRGMTLAIIGCGVMGSAILQAVIEACENARSKGTEPRFEKFIACVNSQGSVDRLQTRFHKYRHCLSIVQQKNVESAKNAEIVMLGCKPYMAKEVLGEDGLASALEGKLLISFVVATPPAKILDYLYHHKVPSLQGSKAIQIVRGMMNLAAQYGESMTVIEDVPLTGDFLDITNWIFSQLGKTTFVAPNLYDIGGVLAGATAAFMSVAVDGMLDGAVTEGIKRPEARKILAQSLRSFAALLENGETPDTLREKFSSPKGTTIVGTMSLEEDRVRAAYSKAVVKATQRSQQ